MLEITPPHIAINLVPYTLGWVRSRCPLLFGVLACFIFPFILSATPGVIINEVSNGPSGSQEWIELLVVGDNSNPTALVDLTGWIVDDNNGDFEGSLAGVGIAQGYIAFTNDWNAVEPGSLILIYNQNERDPLIPPDDETDSNGDLVYILAADHSSLEGCSSTPTTASPAYLPCTLVSSIWSRSGYRNSGDAAQIRMPNGSFYHGFSFGDVNAPFPTFSSPGSPSSWNAGAGGTGSTFSFQCGDWEDSSEYIRSTASGRTPGDFNSGDNENFIKNVRYGHLNYNSLGNPNNCNYSPPTLTMTKTVSNNNPDVGEVFNFIIDASCNSTTEDCDNVVIIDTLPGTVEFLNFSYPLPDGVSSATYDLATREIVISFDASACGSCSPDGIGDNNDFAQGASVQVLIQVQFPVGTIDGYQADNTAYAYSNNAPNSNSNVVATANNGASPGDFPDDKGGDSEQIAGGYQYWSIEVGNIGFDDITNYEIIDTIPDSIILDQVRTPEFTDLDHSIDMYYMRSDNPGVWVIWDNFNLNNRENRYVSGLSLPPSVRISQVRLNMYDVPATGLYNPYIYPDGFTRNWVLYGVASSNLPIGYSYTNCAYYSGVSVGSNINDVDCKSTDIVTPTNRITGAIMAMDEFEIERATFNIEDTVLVGMEFASPGLMGFDVIGGVLSVILPPGFEYVPGSNYFQWGENNANYQTPVIESEILLDGRELIRFVFDSSHSNSFVIPPTGNWEGFRINFQSVIGPATTEGYHEFENYFNATGSDPDNCDDIDAEGYLGGYATGRCDDDVEILVVRAPSSAGLQSKIEVIGTLDIDYNRYPVFGRTVPGGISDYRITLKNPNAATLDQLTFITVLPYVGDTEVLDDSAPRYSEWQPFLVDAVSVPPGMQVYYSTVSNPCRDELAGSNPTPFPSGCNTPSWSLTPPSDITTVTALKFEYGANTIVQGDSIVVNFPMRAPVQGVPDTSIAWNSFGYIARNVATSSFLLPAEPIKVGIELRPGNVPIVGDWVWEDSVLNGIQDSVELGVDGVLVELYHDANNNGLAEPGAGDTLEHFTRTAGGGFYLFSDFDYGNYFLKFSDLPVGYVPTYSNVGSDDSIDSDSLISAVMLFDNTIETYDIDLGLYNGTLPENCTNNIDDDGDGLIDCFDPDCDRLTITNTIGACIDHPLEDIAQLTVNVSWTTPLNDTLEVLVAGSSQIILLDTATSPTSATFNVPADGSIDNIITASWGYYTSGCSEIDSFDAPIACSNDSITCNILYFCGDEKPSDGDAWDHGWIDYLDNNNGTSIVDAIYTIDEPGQGTYDPLNPATFINIDYSKYDLIVVSATTEDHISSDLVDVLKGLQQSIILANFQEVQAFDLSNSAGFYAFDDDLHIDNTNEIQIYDYKNDIDNNYSNVFTHLDYRSDAEAYLWNAAGAQVAENQGVYVHYEKSDVFPTIASHGPRTYFGFHMNQLLSNDRIGAPEPAPTELWFHPARDLTTDGKLYFDQMIIEAASQCGISCQVATLNPHIMYYRRSN